MTLNRNKIIIFLLSIAIILIAIHTIILIIYYSIDNPDIFDFVRMFDLDMERNIPTLFSSLLLTIGSFLFYMLSQNKHEQQHGKYWLGLSVVFLFLAFDESAKIHEQLGDYIGKIIYIDGYFHYPWVILYTFMLFILALIYMRFFLQMEKKIFLAFMASATIYISAAIGLDMIGGNEASLHGTNTILYSIYYTFEESLEMFGVIYLIYIQLTLLHNKNIHFT